MSSVRTNIEQGEVMAETYSGEFYCVKCKAKREASGEVTVNEKGTRMAKASARCAARTSTASSAGPNTTRPEQPIPGTVVGNRP